MWDTGNRTEGPLTFSVPAVVIFSLDEGPDISNLVQYMQKKEKQITSTKEKNVLAAVQPAILKKRTTTAKKAYHNLSVRLLGK